MPLIGDTPTTPPAPKPVPVRVTAPEHKSVVVDTRYTPASSLLTHVEGSSWTVNYYSQVLDKDNALSGQDLNRPAALQQYKLIEQLELKVTSPLQYSQNESSKEQTITGSATIYPCGLIPNEKDHFLADIGDGREGLFEITRSQRGSMYNDSVYMVDYELLAESTQDNRLLDLNTKTVERLKYRADFLLHGQNPLITLSESAQVDQLTAYFAELRDYYFSRFFSREYSTLLLPAQDYPIYDPWLTRAVLAMFRDEPHPNIKHIRNLNVDEDDNFDLPTLWTALLNKRRRDLKVGVMNKIGLVRSRGFSSDPRMDSVRYSGVDFVTYPIDPFKSEDYGRKDRSKPLSEHKIQLTSDRLIDLFELLSITALYGIGRTDLSSPIKLRDEQIKAVNPITHNSYIFSEAFYRNAPDGQSAIELLMQEYLDGKALHLPALTILSGSYSSWGKLEQFYQLPFVMAMIRAAIRRM